MDIETKKCRDCDTAVDVEPSGLEGGFVLCKSCSWKFGMRPATIEDTLL